jgi:hypothetical protein
VKLPNKERSTEMDPEMVLKMTVEGMKNTMRISFDLMESWQGQVEKLWRMAVDQSGDLEHEGEKILNEWLENMKRGREEFRRNLENGLTQMEQLTLQSASSKKGK